MFKLSKYIWLVCLFTATYLSYGQSFTVEVLVKDSLQTNVPDALVDFISNANFTKQYVTNAQGKVTAVLPKGNYNMQITHSNYQSVFKNITVHANTTERITLQYYGNQLEAIVITAKESKGLTSSSKIDRQAMAHLQPSSFTDLLELLPGGKAQNPNLTGAKAITIREYGQPNNQYATGSLGVQFVMDGNTMNSAADMQTSIQDPFQKEKNVLDIITSRNTQANGIDMRTISTNDIDNVEIIRGIPTASYGDLTSGLVVINRKSGETEWQSRLKVDGFSKLYYLAKGFKVADNWHINTSLDYLDAKADPRNTHENYKRFSGSVRSTMHLKAGVNKLKWQSNLDYNLSIDDESVDPDSGYAQIDTYKNTRQNIAFANNFDYKIRSGFFNRLQLNTSIKQGYDDLKQTKWVQFSGPTVISTATEEGVNDGYFPELSYVSYLKTEGRPLDMSYKFIADASFTSGAIAHAIETGLDFKYSKNNGRGQMYDVLKPPTATMTSRPRAFNDIPAYQNLAFFVGDKMQYDLENHGFTMYAGARISKMMGMPSAYALGNKVYFEPRANIQYSAPSITIAGKELKTDVTFGYGTLYKQPTLLMLYPNKRFLDFQQLNFHHYNPNLRYVNFMTYVLDNTNYDLVAAKNIKKEVRLDMEYEKHQFFITYFNEDMKSGFRIDDQFKTFYYNRYDASGLDLENMTEKPNINDLPFTQQYSFSIYATNLNGSRTYKQGIEFGYNSPRFKSINTRITLNGAWFKTIYENSMPLHEKPKQSINGLSFPYVGIYKNDYGYNNSGLNYNCIIDTYLPNLDMNISLSLQGTWFSNEARSPMIAEPYAYYDKDGNLFAFTEADKTDTYKQWLVRNVSFTENLKKEYTFDIVGNLKATKRLYNNLKTSLFVNRLFSYYGPYIFMGNEYERNFNSAPYFGMELTFNF
ncbi:TonB-dependent receptor [Flavobacterium sp. xlx-214]|uniref:TonB-dependent receptor plug domain-containing protein n=1 Tax=unclassified Flavobacterium TaxID=196869 RepID=UPI0013D471A3|nr:MULTISPECIES: TonB-dependent receptor plug domain-containing protein [unclassified Flavobacterium]MBA5793386.1 TonB-dependent receptor [Flavobacterium sp. xlx-221]QMI84054.1 TonB-dependent receptor [Flavobacterium sp. xlx-214]